MILIFFFKFYLIVLYFNFIINELCIFERNIFICLMNNSYIYVLIYFVKNE